MAALAFGPPALAGPKEDRELVDKLDREIVALQDANRLLRQQAATCNDPKAAPDPIFYDLREGLRDTPAVVDREGRVTLVTVPGATLFDTGALDIADRAAMMLDMLSTALNRFPGHAVTIEVHTPRLPVSKGQDDTWFALSAVRASALAVDLATTWKVDPRRLTAAGRGGMEPVADNTTPAGIAANDRVIFRIETPPPRAGADPTSP